jgi:Tfp pilus assembly protein PilW
MVSLGTRGQAEAGYTLVELVAAFTILVIILAGLVNMFVSVQRANTDADARMQSQQNVRLAFDRLEYDVRCAQTATLQSSGQGVHLVLPTWCSHSTGDVTWCVSSGSLVRIKGTSCATAGMTFVTSVTSATPFSCYSPSGVTSPLPQLQVALTVNPTTRTSDQTSATDDITMRNAASGACS